MTRASQRGIAIGPLVILLAVFAAVLSACGRGTAETDVRGKSGPPAAPASAGDLHPVPQPVLLSASGYVQDGARIAFALVVDNPNLTLAAERGSYRLMLYDAAGNVLVSEVRPLGLLLPLQRLGVAGEAVTPTGDAVARLSVELTPGELHPLFDLPLVPTGCICSDNQVPPPFTAQDIAYAPTASGGTVTGVVGNPYLRDARDVRVSALAYDASGHIIGSGFSSASVVPANGQMAVAVPIIAAGTPAKVELFPQLSGLTSFD